MFPSMIDRGSLLEVTVYLAVLGSVLFSYHRLQIRYWSEVEGRGFVRRACYALGGAACLCGLHLWWDSLLLSSRFQRVPQPLHAATLDFAAEEIWGIGPGGNETGLLAFTLTPDSARWAREAGPKLAEYLTPGQKPVWLPTPVPFSRSSNSFDHLDAGQVVPMDIDTYLDRYGFGIEVDPGLRQNVNVAIGRPGSFYTIGEGRAITIVDPAHARVYYAHAG